MKKQIDERIEQLKPLLPDFLKKYYGIQNTRKNFRCIFNTHPDIHPSMSYHPKDHYLKCFSCRKSGNIVTVAALYWGLSNKEAINKLCEEYNISTPSNLKKRNINQERLLPKNIRGLTQATLTHFGVEYDPSFYGLYLKPDGTTGQFFMGPVIKIPSEPGSSSYIARAINSKKFYKPVEVKECLFFASELLNPVVFVTESAFCAMTIWQNNGHAVPLNGFGSNNLMKALENLKTAPKLILSLDKDKQGERAGSQLYNELKSKGYEVINYPISGEKKDPNELFLFDSAQFRVEMDKALRLIENAGFDKEKNSLSKYIAYQFLGDLKERQDLTTNRKTGFAGLDAALGGISDGLYIIGGRPGVGKTTFLDQLGYNLSQIAPVLYFTYEQQKIHFASKHISRLSFLEGIEPLRSSDILSGKIKSSLLDVMSKYLDEDRDFNVYEERFMVEDLQAVIEQYEEYTNKNPIIIIDYLQKMPAPLRSKEKDIVGYLARSMEKFAHAKNKKRTIFLVSSFNRASYYSQISLDSFKENGDLEYAADVAIGIQYHVVSTEKVFLSEGRLAEKQAIIKKEEQKSIRDIDFVCVKNRYGRQFSIEMKYNTEYDYFSEK